ncbi:hypothetical protein AVEN_130253-1 [Araneus ventricosus]|uniref:Uncharacterized protein n=1 Tax=Araneus ventricosus TaxID=182803 RepID=A0A4Y2V7V3_ARAVE|nr:hypothetical protein AVEN_130253-1 [Araneus ventricosus]
MDTEFVIDSVATAEGTTNILGIGDVNLEIMDDSDKVSLLFKNVLYAPQMILSFQVMKLQYLPKPSDKTERDWKLVCVTRQKGKTKRRIDVYYYPEAKVRLRSKNVEKCCENEFSTDVEDISDSEAHLVDIKIPNNFKESQNVHERANLCSATKEEIEILKPEMFMRLSLDPKIRMCWGISGYIHLKRMLLDRGGET